MKKPGRGHTCVRLAFATPNEGLPELHYNAALQRQFFPPFEDLSMNSSQYTNTATIAATAMINATTNPVPAAFTGSAIDALAYAAAEGSKAPDAEAALLCVTRTLTQVLGDRSAHLKSGNLKEGEIQQFACGSFFVTPDGRENLLIAPVNYHAEQVHMRIDSSLGHPGWVVEHKKSLLLTNTDHEPSFVKILRTFKAGSVVYAPIMWNGALLGQIICAAQARNTMSEADLAIHVAFCNLAAALWMAHDGPAYLRRLLA